MNKLIYSSIFFLMLPASIAYADVMVIGSIDSDVTWSPENGVYILGPGVSVSPGVTLTIEPGTIVKAEISTPGFSTGIQVFGSLIVAGTTVNPVYFTSINDDIGGDTNNDGNVTQPFINSWLGIIFWPGSQGQIQNAIEKYSGAFDGSYRAGIFVYGGNVVIDKSTFENNFQADVYQTAGVLSINNSKFNGDTYAVRLVGGTLLPSGGNVFEATAFSNETSNVIDVRNNWWGSSEGPAYVTNPSSPGSYLYGPALIEPWLMEAPTVAPKRIPLIIIPGVMGSYLNKEDGEEVWMSISKMALPGDDSYLSELSLDENGVSINSLVPGDIIRKTSVPLFSKNFFQGLVETLTTNLYVENDTLYVFPYDWRLDIDENISTLNNKINEVILKTNAKKVDIVAHSMGGLLVKGYINSIGPRYINKFIDISTPHTGSPKSFITLNYGDVNIAILNKDIIKAISQNMPSIYELLPSIDYGTYIYDMDDVDNDGISGGLTYSQTKDFIKNLDKNLLLVDRAEIFHRGIDNIDPTEYGVETYNFVGCGTPTLDKIFYFNPEHNDGAKYNISYTNGDGTVPLKSADALPSATIYYVNNGVHALMPSTSGVKNIIASILNDETVDISQYSNLSSSIDDCIIPKGKIISFHSPIDLHVYDQYGNHVGPNINGDIEYGISDVDYEIIGDNKFAFLPEGGGYKVKGSATGSGEFTVKIQEVEGENVLNTLSFSNIPLASSTLVEVTDELILVDIDGNGSVDETVFEDNADLIMILIEKIQNLNINDTFKKILLKEVSNLEKKIEKGDFPVAMGRKIGKLIMKITKLQEIGNISEVDTQYLIDLIRKIESEL